MRIQLENVGIISKCDVEFVPGINLIIGSSGSGKSTLMRCIYNIATNEFTDSDISFGKNTMNVRVEEDENVIEYSRSIKAKGERCYYKVNGETYVKLGRQSLPAVSDALKIGDIDINGDNINFNFNLQFSSPFLILGNQSTLYNVLTYRSTYDISSINDYYAADIRSNASETASNVKLKERLEANLESLETQAEKLSPIEQLYSDYVAYKHKAEIVEDLKSILDKTKQVFDLSDKLTVIDNLAKHVANAELVASKLDEITSYSKVNKAFHEVNNIIGSKAAMICHYENAIRIIQDVIQLNKLLKSMRQRSAVTSNINVLNKCLKGCTNILNKESFVNDAIKQRSIVLKLEKCNRIVNVLTKCDGATITHVDDLLLVAKKLDLLHNINNSISNIESKCNIVNEEISKFKVCPLCGVSLDGHESC